jgi:hypothetical protein
VHDPTAAAGQAWCTIPQQQQGKLGARSHSSSRASLVHDPTGAFSSEKSASAKWFMTHVVHGLANDAHPRMNETTRSAADVVIS